MRLPFVADAEVLTMDLNDAIPFLAFEATGIAMMAASVFFMRRPCVTSHVCAVGTGIFATSSYLGMTVMKPCDEEKLNSDTAGKDMSLWTFLKYTLLNDAAKE